MTTDITIDTDGIIEEEKTLDQLLSSNTYQGMTDEEIDRIIAYRVSVAANEAVTQMNIELLQSEMEQRLERLQEYQDATSRLFNSLISRKTNFITVDPETGLAVSNEQA